MKRLTKVGLVSVLALATGLGGSLAMARDGHGERHCDERRGEQRYSPEQHAERLQERTKVGLARLELALALQPQQQAAWTTFQQAQQQSVAARVANFKPVAEAERPKTALERLQWREQRAQQHLAELVAARKSVAAFYEGLSPAQRTVFDAEYPRLSGMGGHPGMRESRHERRHEVRHEGRRGEAKPDQRPEKRAPAQEVKPEQAQ